MKWLMVCLTAICLLSCTTEAPEQEAAETAVPVLKDGIWRVVMKSPGGDLPFGMSVVKDGDGYKVTGHNAAEEVAFDEVTIEPDGSVRFGISHYESVFAGKLSESGDRIEGEWTKVAGQDKVAKLGFYAEYGVEKRFDGGTAEPMDLGGRWAVVFDNQGEGDGDPAVAEFTQDGAHLIGTFLTPVGDYRFLEGSVDGNKLYLSCFDGGHAFLFTAEVQDDGTLKGDFWSRDSWHEGWVAKRDENAVLEDPYTLTKLRDGSPTFRFSFPDLDDNIVTHEAYDGKVRLYVVFGSWCPNCNDEAPFLQELLNEYGPQGFEVVGLAFEMTNDRARSKRVLKLFQKRHKVDYPILIAGDSTDKELAAKALPDLNHVLSYPTSILVDRSGKVVSIHTGFSGPGTGDHYETLKASFHKEIKALL